MIIYCNCFMRRRDWRNKRECRGRGGGGGGGGQRSSRGDALQLSVRAVPQAGQHAYEAHRHSAL